MKEAEEEAEKHVQKADEEPFGEEYEEMVEAIRFLEKAEKEAGRFLDEAAEKVERYLEEADETLPLLQLSRPQRPRPFERTPEGQILNAVFCSRVKNSSKTSI